MDVEGKEGSKEGVVSGPGLMDLVAALDWTSVALAVTAGDGGGSSEGNEGGNESELSEHLWIKECGCGKDCWKWWGIGGLSKENL